MAEREEGSIVTEIQRLARAEPLAPFVITMASGQRYQIGPDDTLVFGRTTITNIPSRTGHHVLRAVLISEVSILGDAP